MEKIIALKHVGFSLEEIKANLEEKNNENIAEALTKQVAQMEQKVAVLQNAIKCIQAVLLRSNQAPDWDDVAEIIRKIETDQKSDARHFYA